MEIKINEVILLISILIAVLSYVSTYYKNSIKEYGVPEVIKSTYKTIDIMLIVVYLMYFSITGAISFFLFEVEVFPSDLNDKWKMALAVFFFSTFVLMLGIHFIFVNKMKKAMHDIFRSQNKYNSDEKKYRTSLIWSHAFLLFLSISHGGIVTFYICSFGIDGSLIWLIVFMFIVLILVLFSVGSMQAYALRYAFVEYEFIDVNNENFDGWLISEDEYFFIIKISGQTVQHYKKDLIKSYGYKYRSDYIIHK